MKKSSLLLLGAAGLLMASCSSEEVTTPVNDGNFTVKLQLPGELGTRALYGDGYEAINLLYAVYEVDADGNKISASPIIQDQTTFPEGSLETEVGFNLANGKYYAIAFFAESADAQNQGVYSFNTSAAEPNITVNYGNMQYKSNRLDNYDCFYRLYNTGQIGAEMTTNSPTVYLYRPVAQINWGTNDYNEAAVTDENAFGSNPAQTITTTFEAVVFTQFSLFDSNVTGTPTKQIIPAMSVPYKAGITFPVEGYQYLAMQYVLAPWNDKENEDNTQEGGAVYDVNLNVKSATSDHNIAVAVDNCPVQANWRTNIYGSLLTDNFNVYVIKEPSFDGEYEVEMPWDGNATQP